MLKSKPVSKIVCVKRGLSASQDAAPSLIYSRGNRQQRRQYLSRDTMAALGDDLHGYFEAEMVQGLWWLGNRLPTGDRNW
tara:strand:+ start:5420 stop:5659 length:240 start_codon:yes stop_codon:yes gene_type:complete